MKTYTESDGPRYAVVNGRLTRMSVSNGRRVLPHTAPLPTRGKNAPTH